MFEKFPLIPEQASTYATRFDLLFWAQVAFTVAMSMLIFSVIFFFALRYRRRAKDDAGVPIHGNLQLEVAWTAVPFFISVALLVWSVNLFLSYARPPADTLEILEGEMILKGTRK